MHMLLNSHGNLFYYVNVDESYVFILFGLLGFCCEAVVVFVVDVVATACATIIFHTCNSPFVTQ